MNPDPADDRRAAAAEVDRWRLIRDDQVAQAAALPPGADYRTRVESEHRLREVRVLLARAEMLAAADDADVPLVVTR
jgi:hypothetical protein